MDVSGIGPEDLAALEGARAAGLLRASLASGSRPPVLRIPVDALRYDDEEDGTRVSAWARQQARAPHTNVLDDDAIGGIGS